MLRNLNFRDGLLFKVVNKIDDEIKAWLAQGQLQPQVGPGAEVVEYGTAYYAEVMREEARRKDLEELEADARRMRELQNVMQLGNAAAGVAAVGVAISALMANQAFRAVYDAAADAVASGFRLSYKQAYAVLLFLLYLTLTLGIRDVLVRRRAYLRGGTQIRGGMQIRGGSVPTNLESVLEVPQVQTLLQTFAANELINI